VVAINRVTKVVKGGKNLSFAALVVVGDPSAGVVGYGSGKAKEVPQAIRKGIESAKKNLVKVNLTQTSIAHLVLGRYGAGRTLFSGIDDSWRWRFYTGEAVFDTYWIQQFRYLARSKKLGQRKLTFQTFRPAYELGEQVKLSLKVLDPQLLTQLPEMIPVEIMGGDGKTAYRENLVRQEGQIDLYLASYTADKIGKFQAVLPPIAGGVDTMDLPFEVNVPRLELTQPQVDRTFLTRLAAETNGKSYDLDQAVRLATDIPSAAKQIPVEISEPIWNKNRALVLFVLLITAEWVLRKVYGML